MQRKIRVSQAKVYPSIFYVIFQLRGPNYAISPFSTMLALFIYCNLIQPLLASLTAYFKSS